MSARNTEEDYDEEAWAAADRATGADPDAAARLFRFRFWVVGATLLVYALACALPAVQFQPTVYSGFECLTKWPWVTKYVAWYANPVALLGVILLLAGRDTVAFVVAGMAFTLAVTTHYVPTLSVLAGYFCWQTSFAILTLGAGYCKRLSSRATLAAREEQPSTW